MKFRTEITPTPLACRIGYSSRILSLGSCFADTVARRLAQAKFDLTANPTGVLFNPLSIAAAIERFDRAEPVARGELAEGPEGWFHDDFHGSFTRPDAAQALEAMNRAVETGSRALHRSDTLLLTFGTAWVYERRDTGRPVANCHTQPQERFRRRLVAAEEIVSRWSRLLEDPLRDKRIVLTLSPVRHLRDGAAENSLSKAILRVAIAALAERCPRIDYFPAFELLTDDLRDYRFYADDLVHPSEQAARYIWERFSEAALDPGVRRLAERVEALVRSSQHRPLHPGSEAWRRFAERQLAEAAALERETGLDFGPEKAVWDAEAPIP